MNRQDIEKFIAEYVSTTPMNYVSEEDALLPEMVGRQIYDGFLMGVASADDSLFTVDFKKPEVIHPEHKAPKEWMSDAQSVISFFLPFTDDVTSSNKEKKDVPFDESIKNQYCSTLWLHARVEGQAMVADLSRKICEYLKENGYEAIAPSLSPEWKMIIPHAKSNWSERHAAYAAGLGTFGLSRGLITARGMAGRFGSVITNAKLEVTKRPYTSPFEYCIMCGACQIQCPVGAMDKEKGVILGKDMRICADYVTDSHLVPWGPKKTVRYGCGKCQVKVPCEHQIPKR